MSDIADIYKLSIAIPAYGYPKALKRNILSLLKIERSDVEIVVVDNDPTGEQIGDLVDQIQDDRFHYYRNDRNIGRSANIAKAVEMSQADYVLLISCDDIIRNEAVDVIIDKIAQNPDCAIIMGRLKTDMGKDDGYCGEERVYKKGYEALMITPRMGILFPFVINRKYLDFDKLYSREETYMQTRMAYMVVGRGDFVGITSIIADVIDQRSYMTDDTKMEVYDAVDWTEASKTWSLGECYYSPKERAEQLIRDIETIEGFRLRNSHLIRIIDKYTVCYLGLCIGYVASCHDPRSIKNGGTVGFLTCEEALDQFGDVLKPFFESRGKKQQYYYDGTFEDKLQNEKVVIDNIRNIKDKILKYKEVYVFENRDSDKMKDILNYMEIETADDCAGKLSLVSGLYDENVRRELLDKGAAEVEFFDWMSKYLAIVWTENLSGDNAYGAYSRFI